MWHVVLCVVFYYSTDYSNKLKLVDVDVMELRAQADASMPASNNNVNYTIYSNF